VFASARCYLGGTRAHGDGDYCGMETENLEAPTGTTPRKRSGGGGPPKIAMERFWKGHPRLGQSLSSGAPDRGNSMKK